MKNLLILCVTLLAVPAFAAKPSPRPVQKAKPKSTQIARRPLGPSPNSIYFAGLSTRLDPANEKKLGLLAQGITRQKWKSIQLVAHAYRCGNAKACADVQSGRINAVRASLVKKGFKPNKINSIAFGQSAPGPGQGHDAQIYFQKVDILVLK